MADPLPLILSALEDAMKHRARRPDLSDATQFADIGLDALEREELAMALEDALHIAIADRETAKWQSVADVEATVNRLAERVVA